ncbi:MAG: hypothetical protein ABFS28_05295 [Bacteroidota bacterium]
MACCGQKRAALKEQQIPASTSPGLPYNKNSQNQPENKEIRFKYVGDTSMSLIGAISLIKYSFRFKGDICLVDERDAPALSAEADLQKLSSH